jgi:small-conductance mechanosensitive channel
MPDSALAALTAVAGVPAADPSPAPSCLDDPICRGAYRLTGSVWFAEGSYVFVVKPVRIVLIIIVALIIRYLLHRTINRLVRSTASGAVPTILKPLRERLPPSALEATTSLFRERRRQRAEAIGSVLRSFVSVTIFSVALLLILGELGFNLAPLLASAGIAGVALGFGAQSLVKDLIAGLFMLLEDQYGVGDTVDVGAATGVVESVGLRITTVRDGSGVLWYIRNGEIVRVGNKSQGWAVVVVDVPIGFAAVDEVASVLRRAAAEFAADPQFSADLLDPPEVLGAEEVTAAGVVVRTTVRTPAEARSRVTNELRRRLTEALETSGLAAQIAAARMHPRPAAPQPGREEPDRGEAT